MNFANKFENIDFDLINKNLKNNCKLRIDIGTSIFAPVSKFWLENVENIFVLGIEPNPQCWDGANSWQNKIYNIKDTISKIGKENYYYHILGACDDVEHLTNKKFYITKDNVGCSSLLQPINGKLNVEKEIDVEVFSLSSLIEKLNVNLIEMIKIDSQGKDLDILKSMKTLIGKLVFIDVENDSTDFYINACRYNDLHDYLVKEGFELYHKDSENSRFVNSKIQIPVDFNNITGGM